MSALTASSLEHAGGRPACPSCTRSRSGCPRARGAGAPRVPRDDPRRGADAGGHTSPTGALVHSNFSELPRFLDEGDLVVINTSGTLGRRGRRHDARRRGAAGAPLDPAAGRPVDRRGPTRRRSAHLARGAPVRASSCPTGAGWSLLAPYSPGPGGAGRAALGLERRDARTPPQLPGPPRPAHPLRLRAAAAARSSAYQNVYATEPGIGRDAERRAPLHPRGASPAWWPRGSASPRCCCTPASPPSRPTSRPTPSTSGSRCPRRIASTTRGARAGACHCHRHDRGARPRVGGRRSWARAPERRLDRDGRLTRTPRALHRRLPHRLARARGLNTSPCSRPLPGRPLLEVVLRRPAGTRGTCWHEFGDVHLILP